MSNPLAIKVYIIDDDLSVASATRELLTASGFDAREFQSPLSFLEQVNGREPGCVVTDLAMDELDGMEVLNRLNAMKSCMAVIFTTGFVSASQSVEMAQNGAVTVLTKPYRQTDLVNAVEKAIKISLAKLKEASRILEIEERLASLSDEERRVLDLASEGMTNRTISEVLIVSERTVDRRRSSALEKLKINSLVEYSLLKRELK
ncbi:MAG: response regulator [Pirellulaceae bacterium]